jgi:hypothetical protein
MGLADRPGSDMTARLLLALTALYVERATHSPQEQQQYVELALRLIDKVDPATRTTVAGILSRHPDAPAEIFARLGGPPSQLAAREQPLPFPPPHAGEGKSEGAIAPTLRATAPTSTAQPRTPTGVPSELGEAFLAASTTGRRALLAQLAASAPDEGSPADDDTGDDGARVFGGLDSAAMQGRIGAFMREFERLFAMPRSLCERILNDRSGEPMVIVAKAADMPIAVLQRILLLVNPAVSHSVQRVYDLTDLYHGLDRGVARKLAAAWRAEAKPNDPGAPTAAADHKPAASRDMSVAGLRSRFGALTERVAGKGISPRPDPGNAARRDLRSR